MYKRFTHIANESFVNALYNRKIRVEMFSKLILIADYIWFVDFKNESFANDFYEWIVHERHTYLQMGKNWENHSHVIIFQKLIQCAQTFTHFANDSFTNDLFVTRLINDRKVDVKAFSKLILQLTNDSFISRTNYSRPTYKSTDRQKTKKYLIQM